MSVLLCFHGDVCDAIHSSQGPIGCGAGEARLVRAWTRVRPTLGPRPSRRPQEPSANWSRRRPSLVLCPTLLTLSPGAGRVSCPLHGEGTAGPPEHGRPSPRMETAPETALAQQVGPGRGLVLLEEGTGEGPWRRPPA